MQNAVVPSLLPVYKRSDLAFERGEGAWLVATDGRRFLDFGSGIAVTGLGHGHPHLVKALQDQAARLWHVSNIYRIPELERLADRLVGASFAETVFACNSGAEAMEACIKAARRYQFANGRPERNRIVTFEGAFHGRTMATISAAGSPRMTEGFAPLLDGFDHVPFGDLGALEAAIGEQTAAIMLEPIQGEGGIRPAPAGFLHEIRRLCDEHGLLLVYDEVQCGIGRTGKLFGYESLDAPAPDIMGIAKGLGGGFPVGACLLTGRAASGMTAGTHGSTFGGNPLACAVANAVLDEILAPGFLDGVVELGERLAAGLEALKSRHPAIVLEIRGQGLIRGLKLAGDNAAFVAKGREHGLLTVAAADNVVRLLPPMTITPDEIDQALEMLDRTCAEFSA
ncbi:aspartate aminotransferase family protein [Geminicoccus harenae]|uniref:aspartate aminotransferase family protein n=1 Tax=Geminicoccus harenae TaxID=2498453 RepID=UPI00168A48B6|nr:aspartate aminotransferase family protein [Geminicoccus harenae]